MIRFTGVLLSVSLLAFPETHGQDVAVEKYELPNGMTVILHEDHSVPAACINIWYYVASKDETPGRSGFAHLFEHLMFMGTRRAPGGDFDNIMETGGGFNNATTSEDRTNYFSMGPSELLPTLLWLDADRLEDLGEAMTQEKLDKQRAVVRNERRQSYENRPYGKAALLVHELMFPAGHPYHIPVIGTHEDLEAASVEDVKSFFARYYVPSNASLVVAGDFDPETIKPLCDRLFGSLPRGSDVVHATAEPATLTDVKRLTVTDAVQFSRTSMVYHSPRYFQPGDAEMDLTAAILSDGITGRLYKKLVYENDMAVDVSAYQSSMLLGSLFSIEVTAKAGVSLSALETAIDAVVAEFVRSGPTPEELERQKAKLEFAAIARMQSLLGKADALNRYQFHLGEPNSFKRDLDRYRSATADGVRRWAARVLTPGARLILRVVPELEAPSENPRDERPQVTASEEFTPPVPQTFKVESGITVHHWVRRELPLVEMTMLFPHGTTSDPLDKAGLTSLTMNMLDEGAGERDAIEFAEALDQLGARFSVFATGESTRITLSVLERRFDAALRLYADAVLRPRFDRKEWDRVHRLHVRRLVQLLDRPTYVARTVALRAFFGESHPYGRPSGGTEDTVQAITLDDAKAHHARLLRPSQAVILVAGDLAAERLKRALDSVFGAWRDPTDAAPLTTPRYPKARNDTLRVVVVDRPEAVQTVVQFIMPGPVYADPNRVKLRLFNTILGGSFTSRLNQNLREEHGYTYGARCRYSMNPSVGYFTAASSVRADVTGASTKEFLKEFAAIRGGDISAEEARKARSSERMNMIQSFAGLRGIINTAATLVRNGRPFKDLGEELEKIANLRETDLNRLAPEAVPLEKGVLVLVGDRTLIGKQLQGLDLPAPVQLDISGEPIHESP